MGATAAELSLWDGPEGIRVWGNLQSITQGSCAETLPYLQELPALGTRDGDMGWGHAHPAPLWPPCCVSHLVFRACQQIPMEPFLAPSWPEHQPRAPRSPLCSCQLWPTLYIKWVPVPCLRWWVRVPSIPGHLLAPQLCESQALPVLCSVKTPKRERKRTAIEK